MTEAKRGRGRPPKQETLIARAVQQQLAQPAMGSAAGPVRMRYDAAGNGRRMASWNPPAGGPNASIVGLEKIRSRARDASRNDWSGESAIQKWATNLIGIGITPRFKRIKSKARKQQIVDLFADFVKMADADGVLDLFGIQTLGTRTWLDGGEAFLRRRPRFLDEGLPVPLQVQLLEGDMCPLLDADTYPGMPASSIMRSGIELDAKRRTRVAFWFYKDHPGEGTNGYNNEPLVRVLARDVAHVFEPKRPGQLRGVSMLAPTLMRLRNIADYDDTVLERQKLANLVVGFIARSTPPLSDTDDFDPLTNQAIEEGPSGPLMGMQPGTLQELDDGQTITWSNPPEAGTDFPGYMRTQQLGTAAAAGLPYEIFSGDIANVSDRTLRVMINDFRRFAEQRQWQVIIPMLCDRVSTWFAEAALLAGLISAEEFDDVRRVEHAPHGWQHIHPVQDPQGKLLEVSGGLRSRSSVIGERGDDPDQVDDERAADDKREQDLEIGPYNAALTEPEPEPGDDDPAEQQEREEARQMRATTLQIAQLNIKAAEQRALQQSQPPEPSRTSELVERAVAQMQEQQRLLDEVQEAYARAQAEVREAQAAAQAAAAETAVQDRLLAMLEPIGGTQ
jgi:lambda family phage portal protein